MNAFLIPVGNKPGAVKASTSIVLLFILSVLMSRFIPVTRQLIYVFPFLICILALTQRKLKLENEYREMFYLLLLWVFVYLLGLTKSLTDPNQFINRSSKEFYFAIAPLLSVLLLKDSISKDDLEKIIKYTTYLLVFSELILNGVNWSILTNPMRFLINSSSDSESTYAIAYGLLLIYYVYKKDLVGFILSGYLVTMGGKRIVLLAVFLLIISYPIIKWLLKHNVRLLKTALWVSNLGFIYILILLVNGSLDQIIKDLTGLSPGLFTMGRTNSYQTILDKVGYFNFFGEGIGYTSYLLESDPGSRLKLIHSDMLKIYIEAGFFGFIVYLYLFINLVSKNLLSFLVGVLFNIVMLTGNPLIYFHITFILYILFLYSIKEREEYDSREKEELNSYSK